MLNQAWHEMGISLYSYIEDVLIESVVSSELTQAYYHAQFNINDFPADVGREYATNRKERGSPLTWDELYTLGKIAAGDVGAITPTT